MKTKYRRDDGDLRLQKVGVEIFCSIQFYIKMIVKKIKVFFVEKVGSQVMSAARVLTTSATNLKLVLENSTIYRKVN